MIDPRKTCLYIPPEIKGFKLNLFERIAKNMGAIVRGDPAPLDHLPADVTPIVGCTPSLRPLIARWQANGRQWIYWDRGYYFRVFATDLPQGEDGGFYRWHLNSFQMREIRDVPSDRFEAKKPPVWPWSKDGKHIVIAEPSPTYQKFHGIEGWTERTVAALKGITDRPIVTRDKEMQRFGRKLHEDLKGAHALVTHGSNAAVEAVIMGCPVFVHPDSAAALVGLTDLSKIEGPSYPDRTRWLHSLSYSQYDESELINGALWRLIQ